MPALRFTVLVVVLLLPGCKGESRVPLNVSFSKEIQPILVRHCVLCHSPQLKTGGVILDTYAHVFSSRYLNRPTPFVIPGKSAESRLVIVTHTNNKSLRMPPEATGLPPLNDEDIQMIRVWIDEGAKEN